jgi:hypothetical protein
VLDIRNKAKEALKENKSSAALTSACTAQKFWRIRSLLFIYLANSTAHRKKIVCDKTLISFFPYSFRPQNSFRSDEHLER